MRLLAIDQARALWFFRTIDINPYGRSFKDAPSKIGERYSFVSVPTPVEIQEAQIKNEPINFTNGAFKTKRGESISVNFSLYHDGVSADTRSSTTDSDEFLTDLISWVQKEFDLPLEKPPLTRLRYTSNVFVSFDYSFSGLTSKLSKFQKLLQSQSNPDDRGIPFELSALGFWPDPGLAAPRLSPLRIERMAGASFSEDRYWSTGPFSTEKHIKILEALEDLLSG